MNFDRSPFLMWFSNVLNLFIGQKWWWCFVWYLNISFQLISVSCCIWELVYIACTCLFIPHSCCSCSDWFWLLQILCGTLNKLLFYDSISLRNSYCIKVCTSSTGFMNSVKAYQYYYAWLCICLPLKILDFHTLDIVPSLDYAFFVKTSSLVFTWFFPCP